MTPIRSKAKDVDRDYDKDLLLVFDVCDMVGKGVLDPNTTELVLTGETLTGTHITGSDSVYIDLDD